MSFTAREKAAEKALKRLYPFLIKSLNPDVRHELYARDMLTWQEQQDIGMYKCAHWHKKKKLVLTCSLTLTVGSLFHGIVVVLPV